MASNVNVPEENTDYRGIDSEVEGSDIETLKVSSTGTPATSVSHLSVASGDGAEDSVDDDSDAGEGDDSIDDEDDDDDDDDYKHLAGPLWDFVAHRCKAVASAPESSQHGTDFAAFKAYWRQHFDKLRGDWAATKDNQTAFITDPPLKKLGIELLDNKGPHECPCCLPNADPDIMIQADGGITEDGFLEAIRDYLWGENVQVEDLALRKAYGGGLSPVEFMCTFQSQDYLYRLSGCSEYRVWLYCADADRRQPDTTKSAS